MTGRTGDGGNWPQGWTRSGEQTQPLPALGDSGGADKRGQHDTRALPKTGAPVDQDRTEALPRAFPAGPGQPGPPTQPGRPAGPPRPPLLPPRRPGRGRYLLRWLVLLLVALLVFYVGLAVWVITSLQKVDALRPYDARPADVRGETWLLVGSDSREGLSREERRRLATGSAEGRRTDTILLLHVPSGARPTLVSLPRDSYLPLPAYSAGGRNRPAHSDKLNAAYALGGAPLLVRTVEAATGMRVDHYMEVGFAGVVDVVDAVGGVDVCVERAIKDRRAGLDLRAGCQSLDGPKSLGYVRSRYTDPRGDLGRIERQQRFLSALIEQAASPRTLANPVATTRLARAGTSAVRLDNGSGALDLARAGAAMRRVSRGQGAAMTVPIANPNFPTSAGSAVLWDQAGARALFEALRAGKSVAKSPAAKAR